MQLMQRIQSVAGLGVRKRAACLKGKPEIAEFVGKAAAFASAHILQSLSCSHNQGAGILYIGLQHQSYIFGKMLSVPIQGNGIGKATLQGM